MAQLGAHSTRAFSEAESTAFDQGDGAASPSAQAAADHAPEDPAAEAHEALDIVDMSLTDDIVNGDLGSVKSKVAAFAGDCESLQALFTTSQCEAGVEGPLLHVAIIRDHHHLVSMFVLPGTLKTVTVGMPCTQCEVLDVDKYSNPSFGPFSQVLVPYQGFFSFRSI